MNTTIGQRLRDFPEGLVLMSALAVAVVAIEFSNWYQFRCTWQTLDASEVRVRGASHSYYDALDRLRAGKARYEDTLATYADYARTYERCVLTNKQHRNARNEACFAGIALAVLVLVLYPVFAGGRLSSIGITFWPDTGWRYWCLMAPVATLICTTLAVPAGTVWLWAGGQLNDILQPNGDTEGYTMDLVVRAPISEELIYRMAVCVPVAAWLGPRTAIGVSGILFAVIHMVNGNANPVNLVAGFVLAWAFLKSNTILVPIILHSLGNVLGWFILLPCIVPLVRG